MALRAGYYGLKKKIVEKVNAIPGIKEIGSGLNLSSNGTLIATGGGAVYIAGTGIDISEENVISVDDTVIPDMQDLAGKVGYLDLEYVSGVNYLDISKAEIGVDRFGEADADKASLIIPVSNITQLAESIHFWFLIKGTDTLDAIDLYKNNAYGSPVDLKTESPYECVIAPAWTEMIIEFEKTNISMQDLTGLQLMLAPSANVPYYRDFTPNDYILEATKFPRSEQEVLGAKNLLPNARGTITDAGVTWTLNADGTVTANGTATGRASIYYLNLSVPAKVGETYIISDGLGTHNADRFARVGNSSDAYICDTKGGDNVTFTAPTATISVRLVVETGISVNNLTFYPMLRLASDHDDTYAPYAMTNRELTERFVHNRTAQSVIEKGLTFNFVRKDNVVLVEFTGEATEAVANDAKIMDIPTDYTFDLADHAFVTVMKINTGTVAIVTIKSTAIYANTAIAVGDKLRGSFTFAH